MNFLTLIFLFFAGAAVASFFNLFIADYRLIFRKRSTCDGCKKVLGTVELIPLLGYVLLRGKCKHCKLKIGLHHFLGEVMGGLAFVIFAFSTAHLSLIAASHFGVFFLLFFFLALYDLRYKEIPVFAIVMMGMIGFITLLLPNSDLSFTFWDRLTGAAIGILLIGVPYVLTRKRGFGEGDMVLCAIIGFLFGWSGVLLTVVFASFLASAFTIPLLISKHLTRKASIPFVPFLFLGALIFLSWGKQVMAWYLALILF
jgi:prepilin signal peptidase PulO-like enzyme (type II secretory pathway)